MRRFAGTRPLSRWIAFGTAIPLLAATIGIAGVYEARAATGSSSGHVVGTGAIPLGAGVTTVTLDLELDIANGIPTGTFVINDGVNPASPGDVTCLFFSAPTAVIGVHLPGPGIWGLLAIVDNSPGTDTLWLDTPTTGGPVDCTTSPGSGTSLASGDFTVITEPTPTPTPTPEPTPTPTPEPTPTPTPEPTPTPTPEPTPTPAPEPTPTPTPADANLDGIVDTLQPGGTPAGSFVDASLTPPTTGSIVDTGGLSILITDAPDALDGIIVTVGPGAPDAQVELSVCGGYTVLLDPGTVTTGTCGSVALKVATGRARVVLGDGITVVTIPAGGAARVADNGDGTFAITNIGDPHAGSPITLTVDGTETEIPAGEGTTAAAWDFVGFAHPIDTVPVLNRLKAGQAAPLKWRLLDVSGAPVTDLDSAAIRVTTLECSLGTTVDLVEEVATGASGLQNLGGGYYQLNWKTPKTYAKSCKTLHLDIGDGVTHDALFEFTK